MGKKTKKLASDLAALKAEVAALKKEVAHMRVVQGAKVKADMTDLQEKLHAELEQGKQKSKRGEKEAKAKVRTLERKAEKATSEAKAAVEAKVTHIRKKPAKPVISSEQPKKDVKEPEQRTAV